MSGETSSPIPMPRPTEAGRRSVWSFLSAHRWRLAVVFCVAVFTLQIASLYSPSTGFSSFIVIGDQSPLVSQLREAGPYIYHKSSGYDGQAYVQIALSPLLNNPELNSCVDNLPYRARRILLPWAAWICGLGQPFWVVQAYAFLNVAAWFALGAVLLRWFPLKNREDFVRWAAVMFSYGLIQSIRGALSDGPSLLLLLIGIAHLERGKRSGAIGFFAASILCRETLVLGAAAGVIEPRARRWGEYRRMVLSLALMVLPFVLWLTYVKWKTEAAGDAGSRNFEMPLTALFAKCRLLVGDATTSSITTWHYVATVLAVIAILVQFCFFSFRWRLQELWWRVGICYAALMAVLGTAVWEGHPGAFTRVLLPMTMAFNVAVPRGRKWLAILLLGNLGVFGGIMELMKPATDFCKWEGDKSAISSIQMTLGDGWYEPEVGNGHRWAWCTQQGELLFENNSGGPLKVNITAIIAASTPCVVTLDGPSGALWKSDLIIKNAKAQTDLFVLPTGPSILRFKSDRPALPGPGSDTRLMAFAVKDMVVRVAKPDTGPQLR